jgi:hypothetical protein
MTILRMGCKKSENYGGNVFWGKEFQSGSFGMKSEEKTSTETKL